jgi:pimeloyl-ACP methyl ester carboxylesterase
MKISTGALITIVMLSASSESGMAQDAPLIRGGAATAMSRATIDGLELEYEIRGSGPPVVLVHAGIFAEWFKPLLDEPALTSRYQVVSYHRIGYAGSSRAIGPVTIAQQATHLRGLMRHLGIDRAHLIGHSSGGNILLQFALDVPGMVQSLVLMEPALPVATHGPDRMLATRAAMAPVFEAYRAGDNARAVDGFMRVVSGPDYRAVMDRVIPGAFARGMSDAGTFFGQELPALQQWSISREDAGRITVPVLAIVGAKSMELSPIWRERHEMVLAWLPAAEGFVVPGATHLLHVEKPRAVADALLAFFARHPLPDRRRPDQR